MKHMANLTAIYLAMAFKILTLAYRNLKYSPLSENKGINTLKSKKPGTLPFTGDL